MNRTQVENWIESQLNYWRSLHGWRLHMCIYQNNVMITQMDHCQKPHPILYVFTREQIEKGLTPQGWNSLIEKVARYAERYKLWDNVIKRPAMPEQNQSDA